MKYRYAFWLTAVLALAAVASSAQSARDAFWSANDLISVTPNPAARHRSAATPHASPVHKTEPPAVAATSGSVAGPDGAHTEQIAQLASLNGYGAAPHVVKTAETRLGLRCSLLLRGADKQYSEVAPGTVFHSGDHIRLSLLANEAGYLYVIQKGSTGTWSPIYPSRSAGADAAKIDAGQLQVVPGGVQAFQFDQHAGDEKLYVILSRTPVEDIDRVIRNLSHSGSAPALDPDGSSSLLAKNAIPDAFVQKLASRDLTLVDEETVDSSSNSKQDGEKAVYVVAKKGGAESLEQVTLSLDMLHE